MSDHLQIVAVAGHLYAKGGKYHMMLSWKDENGKRQRKSQATALSVRGNKKRAEDMLAQARLEFMNRLAAQQEDAETSSASRSNQGDHILFADFMLEWLATIRSKVKLTTFGGYQDNVERKIAPYFREKGILLSELTSDDINEFYDEMLKTKKATTVVKYHANIHKALRMGKKLSVMESVERPKEKPFHAKFLRQAEVIRVFEAAQGHKLEIAIILGAFYGLRRAEIVGLRWDSIDFDANSITIEHTVTNARVDGKVVEVVEDSTKSNSSMRTLPLIPAFRSKLLQIREEQEMYRKLCGNSYNKANTGYVYTDPIGNRIKPNYISVKFPVWMEKNGFRRLRFHDLRHSCASLLSAAGVSMKQIQEWLGHSDFAITAKYYAHLEYESKVAAANAMTWIDKTSLGEMASADSEQTIKDDNKKSPVQ